MAKQPTTVLIACLAAVLSPIPALACGGCTDAVVLMTLPWAGFGIVMVWLWIVAMIVARWCLRGRDASGGSIAPHVGTLVAFALLGSAGFVALYQLSWGSRILPSLLIGIVWFIYLAIRIVADAVRMAVRPRSAVRTSLAVHAAFLLTALLLVASYQTGVDSLDHRIACLRFAGHNTVISRIMPGIVADGDKAVAPLIRACRDAIGNDDSYERTNVLRHAAFCLERIGGPAAEEFLADLVRRHVAADDYDDRRWYRDVCFSYARCAGRRAARDLAEAFATMPHTAEQDGRGFLLIASAMTASEQGVSFAFDHMDMLLKEMHVPLSSDARAAQCAAERLVFDADPQSLQLIPAHRYSWLFSNVSHPDASANDFTSEFFWTRSSEGRLRPKEEIEAAWKKDAASIRARWAGLFGET